MDALELGVMPEETHSWHLKGAPFSLKGFIDLKREKKPAVFHRLEIYF